MNNLRILIADDERPAREYLKAILRTLEGAELIGEAENGAEAVEKIKDLRPDLALLDLQMPEVSGLEVVKVVPRQMLPLIAFVTAFDQYAIQAFELNAIDYLLKPVEKHRLQMTLARAAERLEHTDWRERESDRLELAADTYSELERAEPIERIPVRKRDDIFLVPVAEIASIVADGELLRITTFENQRFDINFRLKDLETRLDERKFVRLSRGALVNLDAIDRVSPLPGGTYEVFLKNGQEIASSRQQSKLLRGKLFRL
jgi:two-component system, LytTR family, response regulator